jgi:hypothetical protein
MPVLKMMSATDEVARTATGDLLSIKFVRYEISVSSSPRRLGCGSLPCRVRSVMVGVGLFIESISSLAELFDRAQELL